MMTILITVLTQQAIVAVMLKAFIWKVPDYNQSGVAVACLEVFLNF